MEQGFWQRSKALIGQEGLDRLAASHVLIIGLGGVGSFAAEAIARSAVGYLTLVDADHIEASNLNRQLPALVSTLGSFKTEIIAERIRNINPDAHLKIFTCRYEPACSEEILTPRPDYVIDAIDSLPEKIHLIKHCLSTGIPIISSMGTARRLHPELLRVGDIQATSMCPLARRIRKALRQDNIAGRLPVVYSLEKPLPEKDSDRGVLGSMFFVPASAGILLASFAINQMLGNVQ